jgi:hypothetical protein
MKENYSTLAEKIARLLEAESAPQTDLSTIQASIEKISQRLDKIESAIANPQSQIPKPQSSHPSQSRFTIAEAIADAIIDAKTKEKACTFEPNGKPCDHCSMCSSRGF